jgi:hypothetical protein
MAPEPTERSPLLGGGHHQVDAKDQSETASTLRHWLASPFRNIAVWLSNLLKGNVEKRILFAGFLITLSFSFTQVP